MAEAFHRAVYRPVRGDAGLQTSQAEQDRRACGPTSTWRRSWAPALPPSTATTPAVQIAEYARVGGVSKIVLGRSNRKRRLRSPARNPGGPAHRPGAQTWMSISSRISSSPCRASGCRAQRGIPISPAGSGSKCWAFCWLWPLGWALSIRSGWASPRPTSSRVYILGVLCIAMCHHRPELQRCRLRCCQRADLQLLLHRPLLHLACLATPAIIATFGVMFLVAFLSSYPDHAG